MKTSPLKFLATLVSCGAVLAGGVVSAQTQPQPQNIEFSARPLPPLPKASTGEHFLNATTTQAQIVESDTKRFNPGTLFTIESPPIPPDYDATARIVRSTTDESADPVAQQIEQNTRNNSSFKVSVEPKTNTAAPARVSSPGAPDSSEDLDTQIAPVPGGYLVSFANKAEVAEGDLEPVLDAPSLDFEDADNTMETEADSNEIDSLDELDNEVAGDFEDEDRGTDDDLEAVDLDREEDDLQPERRQFGAWPKKPMQEVRTDVREVGGEVPADESGVLIASTQRYYRSVPKTEKVFAWAAPKIRYQPLYFEDAQLERYGQTRGLIKQPFVSGFKFFRDAALLPVNASIDCPGSCDGPLGFCRPGSPCNDSGCSSCQR